MIILVLGPLPRPLAGSRKWSPQCWDSDTAWAVNVKRRCAYTLGSAPPLNSQMVFQGPRKIHVLVCVHCWRVTAYDLQLTFLASHKASQSI